MSETHAAAVDLPAPSQPSGAQQSGTGGVRTAPAENLNRSLLARG
ncbi:hypothetical protein ABZS81_26205 [Streptomyces sp. NPDC005318]